MHWALHFCFSFPLSSCVLPSGNWVAACLHLPACLDIWLLCRAGRVSGWQLLLSLPWRGQRRSRAYGTRACLFHDAFDNLPGRVRPRLWHMADQLADGWLHEWPGWLNGGVFA